MLQQSGPVNYSLSPALEVCAVSSQLSSISLKWRKLETIYNNKIKEQKEGEKRRGRKTKKTKKKDEWEEEEEKGGGDEEEEEDLSAKILI